MPTEQAEQAQQKDEAWNIHEDKELPGDPLLASLIIVSKIYHRPFSKHALTSGLPLEGGCLTPELFVRAAERVGLSAQVVRRGLKQINNTVLPAVVLLKEKQACVLVKCENKKVTVVVPESGSGVKSMTFKEFNEVYSGFCIFVQPAFEFTKRTEEAMHFRVRNWFWSVLFKAWPIYGEVLVASLLINLFAIAMPLFVMNVYDRVVPNDAIETLWVLASGIALVFLFDILLRTLRSYFIDSAAKNADVRLSASIFEQIMGIKMSARPGSVGAFVNSVQMFESFRDFITSTTVTVLVDLPFVFLFIAIIYIIAGNVALIPLVMVPLVLLVGLILQLPLRRLTEESFRHASEKQATLIETLGAAEAIKTNCAESPLQSRWEGITTRSAKTGVKLRYYTNLCINFALFSQQITTVAVVIFGVYLIAENKLTVGALIAATILSGRALASMSQVASLLARYNQSVTSLKALDKIMKMPTERHTGESLLQRQTLQGDIEFRDITFKYPEQENFALNKLSLKIKAGERVGVIGRIGSGKTTLAKLLMKLYEPGEGTVLLDNAELRQLDTADLRNNIGYLPQDIVLFYGSVKDSITFGKPYVDDRNILEAARLAGVDRFISHNPKGFELQVGERGSRLSGGQRQAIALARAILLDPPILLFDEPTNAMDDSTEAMVKENLKKYLDGKTFLLVTHKASLLTLVDRLIVVDSGKVVADGPKEVVLTALREGKIKTAGDMATKEKLIKIVTTESANKG